MKLKFYCLIAALFLTGPLQTKAITTSGVITNAEIWSPADNVLLTGDVTIAPAGSLTILPGTIVRCTANTDTVLGGVDSSRIEIIVDQGTLIAQGTSNQPILFTSMPTPPNNQAPGDWYGLRINSTNTTIRYCAVEFAINGLVVEGGTPTIDQSVFQKNSMAGFAAAVSAVISNCVVRENGGSGIGFGGGADSTIQIIKCTVNDNSGSGVWLTASQGSILNSEILRNGQGGEGDQHGLSGGVEAMSFSGLIISNSTIADNLGPGISALFVHASKPLILDSCVIRSNSNSGIYFFPDHAIPLGAGSIITNCTISGNTPGIALSWNLNQYHDGSGDLSPLEINGNVIQGNHVGIGLGVYSEAEMPRITNNLIFGNFDFELRSSGIFPVLADGNYWGEPTTSELSQALSNLTKIFDSHDDASKGQVLIHTWQDTPNLQTIVPMIGVQPASKTVFAGNTTTLKVIAGGSVPLSYQWFKGVVPVANATNSTLVFNPVTVTNQGDYTVVITNGAGNITSDVATLTVKPTSEVPFLTLQTFAAIGIVGEVGKTYAIQYATDPDAVSNWFAWTSLTNLTLPYTPYVYVDPYSGGQSKRFYRVMLVQ